MRLLFLSVASLLASTATMAQLHWPATQLQQAASSGDEEAVFWFGFTNAGETPVTITSLRSSCGCTVPQLNKTIYQPGESGEIEARFTFEGRTGEQSKTVLVTTDHPAQPSVTLSLSTAIPELLRIRPLVAIWRRGEEPAAKTLLLELLDPNVAPISAEPVDTRFSAQLRPTDDPRRWELVLVPEDTERLMQSAVIVTASLADGKARTWRVYGVVR
jgi:hypothetical protein